MAGTRNIQEYVRMRFPSEPEAVPGCGVCLGVCASRENARSRGDHSGVSDANVELRRHRAEAHAS